MTNSTKTKLKPLGSRVIVQRLEPEDTVKGGIILPDSAKKKQETAVVFAIGNKETTVKVGDKVLMDKYSGQEVTVEDEEFIILKSEDIIAIIEE